MNINEFPWHDAILSNIAIDRRSPGINDTVKFEIQWPGIPRPSTLIFQDVYWVEMKLNFGIVAEETILTAIEMNEDDIDLQKFYSTWKGQFDTVKLKVFKFILNSTASEIKIMAKALKEIA